MRTISDILQELEDKIYSKESVIALSKEGTTDYERGFIVGSIDMINKIKRELNEAKTVSK